MDETVDAVDATVVTDETATMMRDETVDETVDKATTVVADRMDETVDKTVATVCSILAVVVNAINITNITRSRVGSKFQIISDSL